MNSHQENKISMYFKVKTFFVNHSGEITPPITSLTSKVTEFTDKFDELLQYEQEATDIITGYAVQKQNVRKDLSAKSLVIAGGLSAFAIDQNDNQMEDRAHLTVSILNKMRDSDLIVSLQRLQRIVNPVISSLASYGVTSTMFSQFVSLLNLYTEISQNPMLQKEENHRYGQKVDDTIKEIDKILNIVDGIMITISISNDLLYNMYVSSRSIDDFGTGSITPPDLVLSIAPMSIQSVFSISYLESRSFKVKNLSNDPLKWCLSTSDTAFSTPPHVLSANSLSTKLSSTLAPSGDFLLFQNDTPNTVNIEVTIFE